MEIYQIFNQDIELNNHANIRMVEDLEESNQRILRRLLTASGTYIYHPDYGAGLPLYVGQNLTPALTREIKGVIKTQMFLESTVERSPEPKITLSMEGNNLTCVIVYVYKPSGSVYTLSFTISD